MRLAVALALAAAACAPAVRPEYPDPGDEDDPLGRAPGEPSQAERPAPPPRAARGEIARADLVAVLDKGLGAFLGGMELDPVVLGGKFAGWQVVALFPGDERWQAVDLSPGDVILSVNGRQLERPEQVQELWDALRTATRITVAYTRNGVALELEWIVTGPPAVVPSPSP